MNILQVVTTEKHLPNPDFYLRFYALGYTLIYKFETFPPRCL